MHDGSAKLGRARGLVCSIIRLRNWLRPRDGAVLTRCLAAMLPVSWMQPVQAIIIICVPWVEMAGAVRSVTVRTSF